MRRVMCIALACVYATLLFIGTAGEDAENVGVSESSPSDRRLEDDRKSGNLTVSTRRLPANVTTSASFNATRDLQLLNVLAARRRQLLLGRLNAHINTLANLSQKPLKTNTTFAQLEVRDANSTVVKRIVFDDSIAKINKSALRVETLTRSQPITKELVDAQELRNLTSASKLFENNKVRAGFLNNRRKEILEKKTENPVLSSENEADEVLIRFKNNPLYVSSNESDHDAVNDPDEEFQVDESNHGVYLLNYTDAENTTDSNSELNSFKDNKTEFIVVLDETESPTNLTSVNLEKTTSMPLLSVNTTEKLYSGKDIELITTTKRSIDIAKPNDNNTVFMSTELLNHFTALQSELPEEDMAPFIAFGQKLSPLPLFDNATLPPTSTKSYNFLSTPEKRKFTSRYSATEKIKSPEEEETNEDMDVSVAKNVIEKNKLRTSIKGSPPRNFNLVNAYRKLTSTTPASTTFVASTPNLDVNKTQLVTTITSSPTPQSLTSTAESTSINVIVPKNVTRNNMRRRPSKFNPSEVLRQENITTTEKAATLVYTAVVTSVSITSSMKGHNKTDQMIKQSNDTFDDLTESDYNVQLISASSTTQPSSSVEPTSEAAVNTTVKPPRKYRTRIRPTTVKPIGNTTLSNPTILTRKPSSFYFNASLENINVTIYKPPKVEFSSRLVEANDSRTEEMRLAHQRRQQTIQDSIQRRRRPTTTTSTTTTASPPPKTTSSSSKTPTESIVAKDTNPPTDIPILEIFETTRYYPNIYNEPTTKKPLTTTNKATMEPKPIAKSSNASSAINKTEIILVEEGVVIEAEKYYTASYVLAGLGFLPVIAIIVFVLRNIYLKKTKEIDTDYEGYFEDDDVKKESPITQVTRVPSMAQTKPDPKWEFPRNKLRLQTLLGQGNFGQVWKAEADDLTGHDGLTRLVAVKTIKETATQKEKQELLHEICIMQKIGIHQNVVTLLACCTEQEPYLLVMEYVMCGKLLTYLRERRSRPDRFGGSGALTSRDLTVFAYCVARGMEYLCSKGIVHRDLAARNILVDHNKLCKIADFGMSRELNPSNSAAEGRPQRNALPVRWMAPEALLYNVYNHETDIWAYGILLWEIVTLGSTPYATMSGREVLQVVTEGYRLERPTHCKPQLYRTMYACWNAHASQRPPFTEIKTQLAELLENEPTEGNYVDLESFYQDSSVYSDPSAIIQDDGGISIEYSGELKLENHRRSFHKSLKQPGVHRNLSSGNYDAKNFGFTDDFSTMRSQYQLGSGQRMGGFGIRDLGFGNNRDQSFNERKENLKLSGNSFHREREGRESHLVSRNSFNGNNFGANSFQRLNSRERAFQLINDQGRNNRVSEFECDI